MPSFLGKMFKMNYVIDDTDRKLIAALRRGDGGRATITDIARLASMARGTVQTRLNRLVVTGAISGWGPDLTPEAAGHPVTSFTTLAIAQGSLETVVAGLETINQVLEVHVTTGQADLVCRIAARSNDHLHEVIQRIVALDGVVRSDSQLVLASPIRRSLADLVSADR